MTSDDIINLARAAGFDESNQFAEIIVRHSNGSWVSIEGELRRFYDLVAAAEREACAKVCVASDLIDMPATVEIAAVRKCAAVIRARSNP
jgi:hypothetical protein